MNAHLKDSYGNRFVESKQSPQVVSFKPFPQQYVPLQELPPHFAQPLAAPSFPGLKQIHAPQIILGSQYKIPIQNLQQSAPKQQTQYQFPQGSYYAGTLKSLAPHPVAHTQFRSPFVQLSAPGQSYNHLPAFSYGQLPAPFHYGTNVIHDQRGATPTPTAQQQSSSNEAVYANAHSEEYQPEDGPKFQRDESPQEESSEEEQQQHARPIVHHTDKLKQKVPIRETTVTSYHNGVKASVNLKTKPPLPLLDISLLEPLTFDNPLVPQHQHFLPKISQATYHKLPGYNANASKKHKPVHKTKSYDDETPKIKPRKVGPKKKQGFPRVQVQNVYYDEVASASTVRPIIANESPEITYEIDTPTHKETYKEQTINYNKETKSEPVHITYGSQKTDAPVHYTYTHSSKEPVHIKEVHYEGKGEGPKHIVNKINSDEHKDERKHHQSEDSGEPSEEDGPLRHYHSDHHDNDHNINHHNNYEHKHHHKEHPEKQNHHDNRNQHNESPKQSHQQKPEHREEEYHHHSPSIGSQKQDVPEFKPIQYYTKTSSGIFRPINEYEEEIRIAAPIKVNPNQHVQTRTEPRPQSPSQQQHSHSSGSQPSSPQHNSQSHQTHHAPTAHVHDKTKSVTIQEETPEPSQHNKGIFGHDEDNEKEFEQAYKNAAFGFPAYGKSTDIEKDFYTPVSYEPTQHSFDPKNSPFEQYHSQSDNFPKSVRVSYKDLMEKMKDDYFTDLSISKPENLADYYKKKTDYYKLYKNQKPEKYIAFNDAGQNKQKTNEKYTVPYSFYPTQDMTMKQLMTQYKATPFVQEIDYSKAFPRDNSAHSTQPLHRYKSNTYFVEPQFQYGFEPVSIPRLLDSELATMASNNSPESEKPGTRKKFYKENFYIKKTSTSDPGSAS